MNFSTPSLYFGIVLAAAFGTTNVSSAASTSPANPQTSITVRCDLPCAIAIDNSNIRFLPSDRAVKVRAPAGVHRLRAVTLDGKDNWEGSVMVVARPQKPVLVPLLSGHMKRQSDEKTLAQLRQELISKQDQLRTAEHDLEAAKTVHQESLVQRQKSDQLRRALVDYIVQLEGVMQYEAAEISRLQQEMNSTGSVPGNAPASLGGLINAIGQVHTQSLQTSIDHRNERIKRLLKRVDDLTKELGGIRNGQASPMSIPPLVFEASRKDGKREEHATLTLSAGHFALASTPTSEPANPTVYGCTDAKRVSRDHTNGISAEVEKRKLLLRFDDPAVREAAIERWYAVCPQIVNW